MYVRNIVYALCVAFLMILASNIALDMFTRHGETKPVPDFTNMSLDSLYLVANKNDLRIEIIDSIFRPGAPRGTVFRQNPQPYEHVKKNRKIFITINAKEPRKEELPYVENLSLRNAKSELKNRGFGVGELIYVTDSRGSNLVLQSLVKGADIEGGVLLPTGTDIDLRLTLKTDSLSQSRTIVPDVIGQSYESSKDILIESSLNYKLNFDRSIRSFDDSIKAKVYRQEPASGISAVYGQRVNVYLRKEYKK